MTDGAFHITYNNYELNRPGRAAGRPGTMQPFRRLILIFTYIKIVLSVFEGLLRRLLWGEEAVTVNPQSVCSGLSSA